MCVIVTMASCFLTPLALVSKIFDGVGIMSMSGNEKKDTIHV